MQILLLVSFILLTFILAGNAQVCTVLENKYTEVDVIPANRSATIECIRNRYEVKKCTCSHTSIENQSKLNASDITCTALKEQDGEVGFTSNH